MPNYKKSFLTGGSFSLYIRTIFSDAESIGAPTKLILWGVVTMPNYKKSFLTGGSFSLYIRAILPDILPGQDKRIGIEKRVLHPKYSINRIQCLKNGDLY